MRWISQSTVLIFTCFLVGCSSSDSDSNEPDANAPDVSSTVWVEQAKLEPGTDINYNSVYLSGDRALVGGSGSIDNFAGAVTLYERGNDGTWNNVASLSPIDLTRGDLFGSSLSLSGNTALIVSGGDDDVGSLDGSAYVFEQGDVSGWTEIQKILPDVGSGMAAVSIDGDRALLGGSDFANESSGTAYIYERDLNGTWQRVTTLRPGDAAGFDFLGLIGDGVALSGNRALVSSPRDDKNGNASGAVYVYEQEDDGVWREQTRLTASDGSPNDHFGASVSLFGDYTVIGQFNPFNPSHPSSAYVFERNASGDWLEVAKLTASDSVSGDHFGRSVSLFAERVLVAASSDGENQVGAVYEFERDFNGDWLEVNKISVGESADSFGWSISLSGDRALIAAPGAQTARTSNGVAYIFEKTQ